MVVVRKVRTGMWSQSKMATNSPWVMVRAWLRLPALAWALLLRITYSAPHCAANSRNAARRPSSRM